MATEGTDGAASADADGPDVADEPEPSPAVGEYTWADYMSEYGYGEEVEELYDPDEDGGRLFGGEDGQLLGGDDGPTVPSPDDFERVSFDPAEPLGFDLAERRERLLEAGTAAETVYDGFADWIANTPVVKGEYTWEHYKWEYHYDEDGRVPHDDEGEKIPLDRAEALGFDPDGLENALSWGESAADFMLDLEDERTVDVDPAVDEDAFFSTVDGRTTIANRYDLEKAVAMEKKLHFNEVDRYWVNKPYAFVVIFHSKKENERKYYLVEPYTNPIEDDLREFLTGKLRTAIKYASDDVVVEGDESDRRSVIDRETRRLLERYDLYDGPVVERRSPVERLLEWLGRAEPPEPPEGIDGIAARPEPAVLAEDADDMTQYQVEKLLYLLERNFIGYERIDGVKHDINVEDVSCDGYNSPVFVYHTDYEQLISNVHHGKERLDDFVVKLAQRSGKGISKRQPQVDATLPDGSRAQLTLGREVSDHGTNYTIRQFKDVPFTPIDLVNWNTFSLDEMAFLWLCIENNKSLIFAGGTASGKTTSLNAVSLFIPSNAKIVSIEDTREVELPQRNWIASVTRPSFSDDETGDIDEFDLLEAALRQRPDYIVMGEIRGEEGRTLFQVMSTGHTTYTTFHADSVSEVLKRFTTDPINVSKTLFTALDLVSIQTQTRVQGRKVRRNKALTEINHYDPENDEINVQDVFQWRPEDDAYDQIGDSNTLDEIRFDRGWTTDELEVEMFKRQVVLAYLIDNGLNEYAQVAATAQAFINDQDTILALIADDQLERSLEDLRGMESVLIDVDPDKEEMVPRPDPGDDVLAEARAILDEAEEHLFDDYRGEDAPDVADVLMGDPVEDVVVSEPTDPEALADVAGEDAASGTGADDGPEDADDADAGEAAGRDDVADPEQGDEPAGNRDDEPVGDGTDDESGDEPVDRPAGDREGGPVGDEDGPAGGEDGAGPDPEDPFTDGPDGTAADDGHAADYNRPVDREPTDGDGRDDGRDRLDDGVDGPDRSGVGADGGPDGAGVDEDAGPEPADADDGPADAGMGVGTDGGPAGSGADASGSPSGVGPGGDDETPWLGSPPGERDDGPDAVDGAASDGDSTTAEDDSTAAEDDSTDGEGDSTDDDELGGFEFDAGER